MLFQVERGLILLVDVVQMLIILGFGMIVLLINFKKKQIKKSTVSGSSVRVQYDGGVRTDEQLVKENKGEVVTVKGTKK